MTRDDILKLAEELNCGTIPKSNGVFLLAPNIEAFYRAAFNAGIKAAGDVARDPRKRGLEAVDYAIRALEMKP